MREERHWTAKQEDVRVDYRFVKEGGEVVYFSINVSIVGKEDPEDVYRVDTAHGYLHEQRFWRSNEPTPIPEERFASYSHAFLYYRKEVARNFITWSELYKAQAAGKGD